MILETLSELDGDVVLDTVLLLGAAVEDDSVCDDGRFSAGIRASADEVYSYRSENDTVVCTFYDLRTVEDGLGCEGADCGSWWDDGSMPDDYDDVDVTTSVPQHCDYFVPGRPVGCIDRVVDDFVRPAAVLASSVFHGVVSKGRSDRERFSITRDGTRIGAEIINFRIYKTCYERSHRTE